MGLVTGEATEASYDGDSRAPIMTTRSTVRRRRHAVTRRRLGTARHHRSKTVKSDMDYTTHIRAIAARGRSGHDRRAVCSPGETMPDRRIRVAAAVAVLAALLVARPQSADAADNAPTIVTGIENATGTSLTAVNDDGMAIGYSDDTDNGYAIAWTATDGVTKILSPQGGGATTAQAVNASGQVVGNYNDGMGHARPFVWTKDGGTQDLGFVNAQNAFPVGENDAGQIIVETDSGASHNGFVGTPGHWTQIVAPDQSTQVEVEAINAGGDVAAVEVNGSDRAFLWSATQGPVDIGSVPGSTATDVALD
ncbi:MAG: hypothetical protein JOZ82_12430, partial [Marmoricola sp.]|nr:hypothetical protein [Marmoricola sp.]